jgi:hypothetical protein
MWSVRATARRLLGLTMPMPERRSSILWLPGFKVDTHLLRRTTTLRSRRWGTAVFRRARAERWWAGDLPLPDAMAGVDTEDAAGVCAPGVTDVVGGGAGVTCGVTTVGTLVGGAVTLGGLAAGTVAAGGGVLAPGTVTVTGETAGVVAFLAAGTVAARLGCVSTANSASNATVSSAPTKIGRRTASGMCLTAATCRSSGFPSRILNPMCNPFHRTSLRGVVALPLNTLV